jgi:glycine oxidase
VTDTLVIGGGIIGLLTARELALAGGDVTLVEMGETGRESSWAGGGIVSPLYPWRTPEPVTALAGWSQRFYAELATALHDQTGIDPELTRSGLLVLDREDLDEAPHWCAAHGQPLEVLEASRLHALEPELAIRPERTLRLPDICHVRPPRLTQALRRALEPRVRLREHEEVGELLTAGGRVIGVGTSQGRIEAERVVVCAGAWSAPLLARLGPPPRIEPVRGQMILFHAKPGQLSHITLRADHYAIPRRDGRVLFGSTLEHVGFVKTTLAEDKERLYRNAVELFPVLKHTPIEDHWAGLRPGSPNGIPYIGPYPDISGLFINAGHFRNGLVTAPASARLLADLVLGRPPIVNPAPYAFDALR